MAIRDPNLAKDALVSAIGGVNGAVDPSLIGVNELAWGINVACRGGFPASRPRYSKKLLRFGDIEAEAWYQNHLYQGDKTYYSPDGTSYDVVSVGGRIFAINPVNNFEVIELTPATSTTTTGFTAPAIDATVSIPVADASKIDVGYPIRVDGAVYIVTAKSGNTLTGQNVNHTAGTVVASGTSVGYLSPNIPDLPTVWMEQAEDYFVIQNGKDLPIIYDGAISRRADPTKKEVPTGTAMVYNEEIGRLCVAVDGNNIKIGDVVGGSTNVITFTETGYLAEGGAFRVPRKYGPIVGMVMLANLDKSNGQGPMVAFAKRGLSTFNLPPNRDTWKNLTYPPQINMPIRFGATSQASIVVVNGDVFYRGKDGLRSFIYAIREFNGVGNGPISTELRRILEKDDQRLLACAQGMLFDNRLLFTAGPVPTSNGVYHNYTCALDFNPASRMGKKSAPIYDGAWTGLRSVGMSTGEYDGVERAFVHALSSTNKNELWELHAVPGMDDGINRVASIIELRSFICADPIHLREAYALELWVDKVLGTVNFTIEYRPDSYPCWYPWGTEEICVTEDNCDEEGCTPLAVKNAGYKTRICFGQPPDAVESLDDKPARNAFEHQVRVSWTGQCRIRKVLFKARPVQEEVMNDA